jgi:Fe-S-cluster-containing dehydrogenase component
MSTCSLVNEGEANPSLSRIQIMRSVPGFDTYPSDIKMAVCRQCATPLCVISCPTGAAFIDTANGNVRVIDTTKCNGCGLCLSACPQQPHRTVWNPVTKKATKCDLCTNAKYFSQKGGVSGKQACVEACAIKALKFVKNMPSQQDVSGYDINLAAG